MTANFIPQQNIINNQNDQLAAIEESQDVEELNEAELDAVVGGVRCSQGELIDDGSYHMDIPAMPTSILPVKRRR